MAEGPYSMSIDGGTAWNMVRTERGVEPDPERHKEYTLYVDRCVETYPRMRDLMHETVRHVAGQDR